MRQSPLFRFFSSRGGQMIPSQEIEFRYTRGKGPGGQHRNKTASCVEAIHLPTGVVARVDGRNQHANKREAIRELERRLDEMRGAAKAEVRKARRDAAIKDEVRVRTYDFQRQLVYDHRTGKTASLKDVLFKGQLERVR